MRHKNVHLWNNNWIEERKSVVCVSSSYSCFNKRTWKNKFTGSRTETLWHLTRLMPAQGVGRSQVLESRVRKTHILIFVTLSFPLKSHFFSPCSFSCWWWGKGSLDDPNDTCWTTGRSNESWLRRRVVKFAHGCRRRCRVTREKPHSHTADTQRQDMWADWVSFICQISHIFIRFVSRFYFCWWGDGRQKMMKSSGGKRCNGPWSCVVVGGELTRQSLLPELS